jgi:D-sedoheptulose 7-phosphate isomerase
LDRRALIKRTFQRASDLAAANAMDAELHLTLDKVAEVCAQTLSNGGRLLSLGNGGSMCDAGHFAEELTGRYRDDRAPLAALCLNDAAHITCSANDYGFEKIFSRGVQAHARKGDVVLAFSTSGNSANVLAALKAARSIEAITVGFLGKGGGKSLPLCDHAMVVAGATSDRIQEQHIQMVHMLIELIERSLFPENYA